eukprot:TRINITY_DN3744_c0_g1_i3.p1 TRINITY_DN3744_c0_g1~~TRINITY_DN3744_c0_g1_i3.p1  ORF type:complete len:135 (-),score=25.94 TRINITY_DN3744_c0_g1_i3:330-734(-)
MDPLFAAGAPEQEAARKRRLGDDVDRVFGLLNTYLLAAESEIDAPVRNQIPEDAPEPAEPENVSTNKRHKKVSMVFSMLKDRAFQGELDALTMTEKPVVRPPKHIQNCTQEDCQMTEPVSVSPVSVLTPAEEHV